MLDKEIVAVITRMNMIADVPKNERTEQEDALYHADQVFVREHAVSIVQAIIQPTLEETNFRLSDDVGPKMFDYYWAELGTAKLKPPVIHKYITQEGINDAIIHIYGAITTLSGFLEYLEPQYKYAQSAMDRINKLSKCVLTTKTDWKTSALCELMLPEELVANISKLGEIVHACRLRKELLDDTQAIISRVITLRMQTPTTEMSRSVPESPVRDVTVQNGVLFKGGKRFGNT